MIYINNETVNVKVPKFNREYEQNRLIAKHQLTGIEWTFHLTDYSTNEDFYEFRRPSFNCNAYVGSYDYQILYDDIVLTSGIVVVEGDSDLLEKVEYQPEEEYIYEYTPNVEPVIIPDRVKYITENGEYDVNNYNKVDVNVNEGAKVIELTQTEYNNLAEKDANTIYLIIG